MTDFQDFGVRPESLMTLEQATIKLNSIEELLLTKKIDNLAHQLYDLQIKLEAVGASLNSGNKNIYAEYLEDYIRMRKIYDEMIEELKLFSLKSKKK